MFSTGKYKSTERLTFAFQKVENQFLVKREMKWMLGFYIDFIFYCILIN